MADTLFDTTGYQVELPPPQPQLSQGRRRTLRQAQAITNGQHPIGLALGVRMPLHPDAPRDRDTAGPRCGSCRFREVLTYHRRSYGKCVFGDGARISHSVATDVRRWWPACRNWTPQTPEPGESR